MYTFFILIRFFQMLPIFFYKLANQIKTKRSRTKNKIFEKKRKRPSRKLHNILRLKPWRHYDRTSFIVDSRSLERHTANGFYFTGHRRVLLQLITLDLQSQDAPAVDRRTGKLLSTWKPENEWACKNRTRQFACLPMTFDCKKTKKKNDYRTSNLNH